MDWFLWFTVTVVGLALVYLEHLQEAALRKRHTEGKHTGYGL